VSSSPVLVLDEDGDEDEDEHEDGANFLTQVLHEVTRGT
jgi:hypothetical protein